MRNWRRLCGRILWRPICAENCSAIVGPQREALQEYVFGISLLGSIGLAHGGAKAIDCSIDSKIRVEEEGPLSKIGWHRDNFTADAETPLVLFFLVSRREMEAGPADLGQGRGE